MGKPEDRDEILHLRLERGDAKELAEIHVAFPQFKRPDLIRQLLRIGCSVALSDPTKLVTSPTKTRGYKASV